MRRDDNDGNHEEWACQWRDGIVVKRVLNGDRRVVSADVFQSAAASRFVAGVPGGYSGAFVPATALTRREKALALFLSRCSSSSAAAVVGDIDLRVLPGPLVHDWLAFPQCCAGAVWVWLRREACAADAGDDGGVGGFSGLSELSLIGP
jgi:hypothetical protein